MIYRLLLGLDSDDDTRVATQYGLEIAKRFSAQVTGLAVIDTEHIKSEAMGSGIGSMHYASKLRDKMLDEARDIAAIRRVHNPLLINRKHITGALAIGFVSFFADITDRRTNQLAEVFNHK